MMFDVQRDVCKWVENFPEPQGRRWCRSVSFLSPLPALSSAIDCYTSAYRMHELHAFSQSWWLQQQLQSEGTLTMLGW